MRMPQQPRTEQWCPCRAHDLGVIRITEWLHEDILVVLVFSHVKSSIVWLAAYRIVLSAHLSGGGYGSCEMLQPKEVTCSFEEVTHELYDIICLEVGGDHVW